MSDNEPAPANLDAPTSGARSGRRYVRVRSFIVVIGPASGGVLRAGSRGNSSLHTVTGAGGRLELGINLESPSAHESSLQGHDSITLVLGDDSEFDTQRSGCMAYGVSVKVDLVHGSVELCASIVGLPSVFVYRFRDKVVLTSAINLLTELPESLSIDEQSAVDLIHVGYPTAHRTLFRNVSLVPGGHLLTVAASGDVNVARAWSLPVLDGRLDWPSYLDLQSQAFRSAVRKLDLSRSFLALTGGLDTRAVLAALVSDKRTLAAATLSGPALSLDARLANALCRAYALPHHVVRLGDSFLKELPEYVTKASWLTGGLASVEKAAEIYFYGQIGGGAHRELSGNLGNQVGRQAFEAVSARGADTSILADQLTRNWEAAPPRKHIFSETQTWHEAFQWFLQEEATLGQVGDFCLGQHFATQQTPYASRALIETLSSSPLASESVGSFSSSRARWRDLSHRFLGENRERSFQRTLIAEVGGFVASCPINLGWRPRGGVSLKGLAMGLLTFADMTASSRLPGSRLYGAILEAAGIRGLHETKMYRTWLSAGLKDFVYDTLRSQRTRESGLFNVARLDGLLHEHFDQRKDQHRTIIAALDLALAYGAFCATGGHGS